MRTPKDETVKRFVKWALWYAKQGYRVAPMWQDTKRPVFPNPDLFATIDPDIILAMWGYGDTGTREQIIMAACRDYSEIVDKMDAMPAVERAGWVYRVRDENARKLYRYANLQFRHTWNVGIYCGPTKYDDGEPCGPTMIDIDGPSHGSTNGMTGFDSWKALTGVPIEDWDGPKHQTPSNGYHVFVDHCPDLEHGANALGGRYPHIDIVQCNLTPVPPSIYGMQTYKLHNWAKRSDLPPVPTNILNAAKERANEKPKLKLVKKVQLELKDFPKLPKSVMRNYANTFEPVDEGSRAVTAYHNAKRLVARFPHLDFEDYMDVLMAWNDSNNPPLEFNYVQAAVISALGKLASGDIALVLPPWMDKSKRPSRIDAYRVPDVANYDAEEYICNGWIECKRSNLQLVADMLVRKFVNLTDDERLAILENWTDYIDESNISKRACEKALEKAKAKKPFPSKKKFLRNLLESHGGNVTSQNALQIRESIKTLMPSLSASERMRTLKGLQTL